MSASAKSISAASDTVRCVRRLGVPHRLRRETTLRLGLVFAPLAFVVAIVRLTEFTYVANPAPHGLGAVLWNNMPAVVMLTTAFVASFVAVTARLRHRHPLFLGAAGAGLAALIFAGGKLLLPWWVSGWVRVDTFNYLRWDLLAVLLLWLTCATMLTYAEGRARRAARWGTSLVAVGVLLFYLVEASVLATTGLAGSYYMMQDLLTRPEEVFPLLVSELKWIHVGVIALPVLLVLSSSQASRLNTKASPSGAALGQYGVGRVVWTALPFVCLLTFTPSRTEIPVETSVGRFVRTASFEVEGEGALGVKRAEGFDTRNLRVAATDSTRKRNVVVVVMESVRSRSTGLYAPDLDTTPFLDSLAQQSLLVERFYAPVSYTNKSLVSLFAGVYPSIEGYVLEGEAVPGGVPARGLPALLTDAGYRSAFFTPAVMAFERKDVILSNLGFAEIYGDQSFDKSGFTQKAYFGYEDRVVLDATFDWVDRASEAETPFMLGMLTLSSHHPYDLPPSFETRDYHTGDEDLDAYLNAIRYTDVFVRDLMAGFEARGLLEETVFIFVGDHGEAFGEHSQRMHGDVLWDEALQVPALVYAPGTVAPGRVTGARHSIDVAPTILDVLNLETAGASLLGTSLLDPVPDGRALFHACRNARAGIAVRQDSLKYLYWMRRPTQVFNTLRDPEERVDIADELPREHLRRVEAEARTWYFRNERAYKEARPVAGTEDIEAWREENERLFERAAYWRDR